MTITDPRERLIVAGSAVLEAAFKEQQFNNQYAEQIKALRNKDDTEAATKVLESFEGSQKTEFLLGLITLGHQRESAVKEYVMMRETIEAMTASRPALPGEPA